MKRLVILVLIAFCWLAPTALGWQGSFDRWDVAQRAAQLHWGGDPPCGHPTILHHQPAPPAPGIERVLAWVTVGGDDCTISVTEAGETLDPGEACALVVHEAGHLRGLPDVNRDHDIMNSLYPSFDDAWGCRRLLRRVRYGTRCISRGLFKGTCNVPVYRWLLR